MTHRMFNGKEYQQNTFRIEIDPSQSPKTIDQCSDNGTSPILGIYKLEGDVLKTCWESGQQDVPRDLRRPTKLAPCQPGEPIRWSYSVYQRVKP